MKFIIKKEILLKGLNSVSKALSNKNLIPILSGIKIDLKKEGLYLNASDNDISIEVFIDSKEIIKIEQIGSTVVQGRYILEIIRKLEEENINIELLDNIKLHISSGLSEFILNSMDPNEFPNLSIEKSSEKIFIDKKSLKEIINKTSFAISAQETRPILTGINFKTNNNELEAVATDSYRLSKKKIKINNQLKEEYNVIIPGRNLIELLKLIDDLSGEIELNIFNNKVVFKFENIIFQSRVLTGTFPDISKLIPDSFNISILLKTSQLYNVIDRASLLTSEKEKNIINFQSNEKEIIISSNTPEIGRVEEKIQLEEEQKKSIKIAFSSKFLLDSLRTIDNKSVLINFNGEVEPIIIKDPSDDSLIQLILPIKTY